MAGTRTTRWFSALRLGLGIALAVLPAVVPAAAAPLPSRENVQLPLATIGIRGVPAFQGRDDVVQLVVPVPDDLTPAVLRGTLQVAAGMGQGRIDLEADKRLLARVEIPPGTATMPFEIPLAGVPVVKGAATIALHAYLTPLDDEWCVRDWADRSLSIVDAAVEYAGLERQPTVIADFLPPVLTKLSLFVPESPAPEETEAALTVGTAVAARFANQIPAIDLQPLGPGNALPTQPPGLLERRIAITRDDKAGITLATAPGGPVLRITGRGDDLINQVRLLTSNLAWIAFDTAATAGSLEPAPQIAPDTVTLRELGALSLSATSVGRVRIRLVVDQTRLGRPSGSVRMHLRGNYTPLPNNQNGQITVTTGDVTLAHWPVDDSGGIDRWIDVPDAALSRFTELVVTLQTAGAATCGSTQPVTLTIDPSSTITSTRTVPPVPGGFEALPQALMPTVQVGLREGSLADARRALEILTGVQRLSVEPLRPELADFDDAASSSAPAILIAADGRLPDSVRLPLTVSGDTVEFTDPNGGSPPQRVEVPGLRFASLQAFWDGNRMLVVATSTGVPAGVDRILDWLRADPLRWFTLRGVALMQAGDRDPVMLGTPRPAPSAGGGGSGVHSGLLIAGGVLLAVGLLVAIALLARPRRSGGLRP